MKKFFALFLALMMVVPMVAMGEAVESPSADATSSASTTNHYAQFALVGEELAKAVNSTTGFYLIVTVNPDGSANAGYFIFAIKELNGKQYLQLGLAPNQTKANLEANGEGLAIYAALPAADATAQYAVSGARFYFKAIEDQAIVDELMKDARPGAMFFEVTEVLPLG